MSYQNTHFTQEELTTIQTAGFSRLFSLSTDFFKKHWSKLFLVPTLTVVGINIVLGIVFMVIFGILIFSTLGSINTNTLVPQLTSGFIFVGILSLIFYFGVIFIQMILQFRSLELLNNKQMTGILESKNMYWNALGVFAIYMVSLFGIGAISNISPTAEILGIIASIPVSIVFSHSMYIALFENIDPQIAIAQGFKLCKINAFAIFKNSLGIIATALICTIGFLILGSLVLSLGFAVNSSLGVLFSVIVFLAFVVYLFCLSSVFEAFSYGEFLKYRLAMLQKAKKLD